MERLLAIVVGVVFGLVAGSSVAGIAMSLGKNPLRGMRADGVREAELWDPKTGEWSPAGKTGRDRNGHQAARIVGDRVLIIGNAQLDDDGAAEVWDPALRVWSADRPPDGEPHAQLLGLSNGEAFIVGARARRSITGSWSQVGSPLPGALSTASIAADGELVLVDAAGNVAHAKDGGWRTLATEPARYVDARLMGDGRVLLVDDTAGLRALELRDGGWERLGVADAHESNPTSYIKSAVTLSGGRVLMVGETGAALWEPNTDALRWRKPPPELQRNSAWAAIGGDEVLVVHEASAVIWNPVGNSTRPAKPPEVPRGSSPTLTGLSDGRALLVGGWSTAPSFYPDAPARLAKLLAFALLALGLAVTMFKVRRLQRGQISFVLAAIVGACGLGALALAALATLAALGGNRLGGG